MDVLVVDHPLAQSRLTAMRDARTDSAAFRASLHELTTMLVYEATRRLPVERYPVQTPVAVAEGFRLANPPLLVPVLRAGLGMAEAALGLLPEARMGFVGLARDEETYQPRAYMESLPADLSGVPVLVLDPMLATGGTLEHCCRLLAERGSTDITVICALAAPAGVDHLDRSGLPLPLVTPRVDKGLTERSLIAPALSLFPF
ncbi:MAG: uracil phosphoribosyltransferase, partial [Actinobacteria bacterium]